MNAENTTDEHITNNDTLHDLSTIVVLIVSVISVGGNALTLCAFQYAKIKKKYQFNISWNYILVFIWNLALIDFISSINMTILYAIFTFHPNVINQYSLCVSIISLRDIFVLISAISISCIAVVTLIGVTKNNLWMNFCDDQFKVLLLISLCWAIGLVVYIAKIVKIADDPYFSKQERTFDCGTFFFRLDASVETLYSEFILHTVVFAVIIVSYGLITLYASEINSNVDNRREGVHVGGDEMSNESKCFKGCFFDLHCIHDAMCSIHDLPSFLRRTIEARILHSICVAGKNFIHHLLHSIFSKHFYLCCKERKLSERIHVLDQIRVVLLSAW